MDRPLDIDYGGIQLRLSIQNDLLCNSMELCCCSDGVGYYDWCVHKVMISLTYIGQQFEYNNEAQNIVCLQRIWDFLIIGNTGANVSADSSIASDDGEKRSHFFLHESKRHHAIRRCELCTIVLTGQLARMILQYKMEALHFLLLFHLLLQVQMSIVSQVFITIPWEFTKYFIPLLRTIGTILFEFPPSFTVRHSKNNGFRLYR